MPDDAGALLLRRINADEFEDMVKAGILRPEERVELLDGVLCEMAPIGREHVSIVDRLTRRLVLALGDGAIVSVQNSFFLDRFNVPEPDFAILRDREDFYGTGDRAGPADVLLFIEVADSSLKRDRLVKLPLYAEHAISEVWIVDVKRRVVSVHRRPEGRAYAETSEHAPGEAIEPVMLPGVSVPVTSILG